MSPDSERSSPLLHLTTYRYDSEGRHVDERGLTLPALPDTTAYTFPTGVPTVPFTARARQGKTPLRSHRHRRQNRIVPR
jgi:hypothetical protein